MKIKNSKKAVFVLALVALPMFTGCASIVNGPTQNINIATHDSKTLEPISANCTVSNAEGSTTVVTPSSVSVNRDSSPLSVSCVEGGYSDRTETFDSRMSGWMFGNILFGGLVGIAVDAISGSAMEYLDNLKVFMNPVVDAEPTKVEPATKNLDGNN